jgi:hypothetical protein
MTFHENFINHIQLENGFGLLKFKHTILSTTPQQYNYNDCGIFTCMFGNDIHKFNEVDVNNSTQAKISYFRLFILFTFLNYHKLQLNEKYEQIIKNENNYKNSPIIIMDETEAANTTTIENKDENSNNNNKSLITANKPVEEIYATIIDIIDKNIYDAAAKKIISDELALLKSQLVEYKNKEKIYLRKQNEKENKEKENKDLLKSLQQEIDHLKAENIK